MSLPPLSSLVQPTWYSSTFGRGSVYPWLHVHAPEIASVVDDTKFEREEQQFGATATVTRPAQHHHTAASVFFRGGPACLAYLREQAVASCILRVCRNEDLVHRGDASPLDAAVQPERTSRSAVITAGDARKPRQHSKRNLQNRGGELRFVAMAIVGKYKARTCRSRANNRVSRPWPVCFLIRGSSRTPQRSLP